MEAIETRALTRCYDGKAVVDALSLRRVVGLCPQETAVARKLTARSPAQTGWVL